MTEGWDDRIWMTGSWMTRSWMSRSWMTHWWMRVDKLEMGSNRFWMIWFGDKAMFACEKTVPTVYKLFDKMKIIHVEQKYYLKGKLLVA